MDCQYLEIVRALPRPTWLNCLRFVWYVSDAHSWYKHLPSESEVPFLFYLNPHAGMQIVKTRTDEQAVVEITDESTRFHYTWQTTQSYRARFGHWEYDAAYGNAFLFAGEGGTVTTERHPVILSEEGQWLAVPETLHEGGTAMVNAFVDSSRMIRPFFRFHASDKIRDEDALVRQLQSSAVEYESALRAVRGSLSHELSLAVQRRCDAAMLRTKTHRIWYWHDVRVDRWLTELDQAGASTSVVPTIFATLQSAMTERIYSAKEEGAVSNDTYAAIVTTRIYQLWNMWSAIQRFDKLVFGDTT